MEEGSSIMEGVREILKSGDLDVIRALRMNVAFLQEWLETKAELRELDAIQRDTARDYWDLRERIEALELATGNDPGPVDPEDATIQG